MTSERAVDLPLFVVVLAVVGGCGPTGALIANLDFPSPPSRSIILSGASSFPTHDDCPWRANVSDIDKLPGEKLDLLEDCLFTYLAQREARSTSADAYKSLLTP